jgi:parvulin-like peptidyl-prolyl isomerase
MANLTKARIDSEEILKFLKKQISLKDVNQKILSQKVIQRAAAERNLTVTDEEIQAEADRFRFQNRLEKASDTIAWINNQMISVEDWEQGICDRILAQKLASELFSQQVEKYFAENRLEFDQALLYQILVPHEPVARELFYQIEDEEISFFEAAHLYDINEQRRLNCGYQGWVHRAALKQRWLP